MGIRIHKKLGYGLTDVKYNKRTDKLEDPRFNADKLYAVQQLAWETEYDEKLIEQNRKELKKLFSSLPDCRDDNDCTFAFHMLQCTQSGRAAKKVSDAFTWDSEFGLSNVMLFQPGGYLADPWSRYDDTIDYIEETEKGQRNHVKLLKGAGIYPYLGWVRFRDPPQGLTIKREEEFKRLAPAEYSQLVGRWDKKQPPTATGKLLTHLLEDYRPILPLDVIIPVWFFREAFTVPVVDILNALRPALYVYWS